MDQTSREARTPGFSDVCSGRFAQILGVQALGTLLDVKFYSLTFFQGFIAIHFNSRKMYEYIIFAVVRGDKPITLGIVEPA